MVQEIKSTDNVETALRAAIESRKHEAATKISELRRHGVNLRKLVEITLREGAEFSNDTGPAGAADPEGYYALTTEQLRDNPGDKVVGYVLKMDEDSLRLSQALLQKRTTFGPGSIHVSGAAVHSFYLPPGQ
jgi:hypothetical protein